jgi:hypothetical protein
VRAYYESGKLPENGTVCEIDEETFPIASQGGAKDGVLEGGISAKDLEMLEKMRLLADIREKSQRGWKEYGVRRGYDRWFD